jgi:DNA (cytosine-5)-methyltransferase 1
MADTIISTNQQSIPQRSERAVPGGFTGGGYFNSWAIEPEVDRVANGVPRRVDRLRALGNAVVPQQVYPILKAIAGYELQESTKP